MIYQGTSADPACMGPWQTSDGAGYAARPVGQPSGGVAGRAALGVGKRMTGKSKDDANAELLEKAADEMFRVSGSSRAVR